MPRDILAVKQFKYGVISSVDAKDIPIEAASDNLNVDGDVGEGILQGIPTDTTFTVGGSALVNVKQGIFVENNGIYDFIYHDANAKTINAIVDFYGTPKKLILVSSLGTDNLTFQQNKKEAHIGIDGVTGKWIGHCAHTQFSRGTASGDRIRWAITDATNTSPIVVETSLPHSLKNGNIVFIDGVTGNTAANGYWIVSAADYVNQKFTLTGSVGNGTFGGTAYAYQHLCVEALECTRSIGTAAGQYSLSIGAEHNATNGYFKTTLLYRWGLSLIYDGVQESFLDGNYTDIVSGDSDYYPLTITANKAGVTVNSGLSTSINKRVTGINLYRAESTNGTIGGLGLYRKVAELSINDTNWAISADDMILNVWDYGTYFSFSAGGTTYPSDNVTYQENSGLPSSLFTTDLHYALSAQGNGYLFIGNISFAPLIGVARTYILKSKFLRFDTFDYTSDFLVMPEAYNAMQFYEGKLYVFSTNRMYRINPEGLYIEDVFEDVGCQGQRSVHTTEYGMFFGNSLNAYMYQGGQISYIGDAIRQSASGGKSWKTFLFTTLTDLIVTSDAKKGYILFINERTDSTAKYFCWAYSPIKGRWDAWSFGGYDTSANGGIIKGKNGEVYLSNASNTYKLMRGTGYQSWEWYSQDFVFNEPRQNKSITMIKVDSSGTVSITYGTNGGAVSTSYTNESLINDYYKSIRVKLNAASGSNTVDSMEIVYRPLVGKR